MPRAQIPAGYAKVVAGGTYGPAVWANVFYLLVSPADGTAAVLVMQDLADMISTLYGVAFGHSMFADSWELSTQKVFWVDETDSIQRATIADSVVGDGGSSSQDAQVSYLVNWHCPDPRRGGKPRQYICGVPDSVIADSASLDSTTVATVSAALNTWLASLAADTWTNGTTARLVEMSFVNGKVDRTTPLGTEIVAGSVNNIVATQRRRVDRLRS